MEWKSGTKTDKYCAHCAREMLRGREDLIYCPDHINCDWSYDYTDQRSTEGDKHPLTRIQALEKQRAALQRGIENLEDQRENIDKQIADAKALKSTMF